MKFFSLKCWLFLCPILAWSADQDIIIEYIPRVREIPSHEKAINFGFVYGVQWTYYLTGQYSIIKKNGSFENWHQNMFSPHFDKDSFDFNIFKHTLTGNYYYLWYRSRGYDRVEAFWWSFLSSLAFEFTIETTTERPSYQDMYQTPVYGTVIGVGVEKLSLYFHKKDTWWGHGLGYVLNPFTLIPQWDQRFNFSFTPILGSDVKGLMVGHDF
jgi:hypothetical protein